MCSSLTLSGRPAKSEHLRVDQDEALIFLFIFLTLIFFFFYRLFCDGRNVQLARRRLFQLGEAQSEHSLEHLPPRVMK